jgi:hypothetical protein
VSGPHDLPPGRRRRGDYLLAGKIPVEQAHPLEVAYAVRHIASHPSLEADAWQRSREDQVLAELRATLGAAPWVQFGPAALAALAASGGGPGGCRRCRANLVARTRRLSLPDFDEATNWLIGPGCRNCRQTLGLRPPAQVRPGGAARPAGAKLRPLAALRADVRRLLAEVGNCDPPPLSTPPPLREGPILHSFR